MTKTLLMIHGVGCGGEVWDRMAGVFRQSGWRCETPTLYPNLRVRDAPRPDLAALGFADYVAAMSAEAGRLAAETGAKPAVIGHSMGGLIAQKLAERGDVSKAVFLTPAQPKDCAAIGPSVLWTFANILISGDRTKGHKVWKTGFKFGVLNRVDAARHDEIYADALYDSGQVYGDMTDGVAVDESKVAVPTLTIAAGRDRATLAKAVRKVGEKYARAAVAGDFIEYPDNAHWIVDEPGTDRVASDILDWLARPAQSTA